jgi:hypothetical protein
MAATVDIPAKPDPTTNPLDIQDYLNATSEASLRARTVSFLIVAASIVVFAGLLNSLQSSWMLTRIQMLNHTDHPYVVRKIGEKPDTPGKEYDSYQKRYESLYSAYARSYVENTFAIRVPFFGFTFDVNDLGLLGGLALLILLTILRFCLSREINNLDLSFPEANRIGQLKELYMLLAMRQVLTVPQTGRYRPKRFLIAIPKILCFLPVIVHASVTIQDALTIDMFKDSWRAMIVMVSDFVLLAAIGIVTFMVITRLMRIDLIWANCWKAIENGSDYHPTHPDTESLQILKEWRDLFPKKAKKVRLEAHSQRQINRAC